MNKKRIIKSVIRSDELEWDYNFREDKKYCRECGGLIFYIKELLGVIREESDYSISGYKDKIYYRLGTYGFKIYCAECGEFEDLYFLPKADLVCTFEELDGAEKEEIQHYLAQYNQKKDYIALYKTGNVNLLKQKIQEHERQKKN